MSDLQTAKWPCEPPHSNLEFNDPRAAVSFTVPGPAKAKGRGRVHRVADKVYVYPDETTVIYENWVKIHALKAWDGRERLEGAIDVSIDVVYAPARTTSKKDRAAMLEGRIRPTKYPDLDNIVKAVIDGCKSVIMRDDVQVVDIRARKRYGLDFRVDVTISPSFTPISNIM